MFHHVECQPSSRRCAGCGARWRQLTWDGAFERVFHALPVGLRQQFIVLHGHRQACSRCGRQLREPILFADGKRRYIRAFGRYVTDLCRRMPIKQVAGQLGVGWDLVKGIFKEHLKKRLKKRRLRRIRRIGVDEFAVHKGHRYMTVVVDLDTGEIVHAQEGKDAGALVPFLRRLRRARARLEAVAIDMSAAYLNALRTVFGDRVAVVHDRYHVVALANKAVDETRRDLVRELSGDEKSALKGTRFLWLRAAENLQEDALTHVMSMMAAHEPLFEAWLLKELLRDFWEFRDRVAGELFLGEWLKLARATQNKHLVRLAATLDSHRAGLLAYFEHRITSAQVEGTNNKIKVLKRQAYGFRDIEFFKLRLYFLHEANLCLAG